jgi:hypothetical protein
LGSTRGFPSKEDPPEPPPDDEAVALIALPFGWGLACSPPTDAGRRKKIKTVEIQNTRHRAAAGQLVGLRISPTILPKSGTRAAERQLQAGADICSD